MKTTFETLLIGDAFYFINAEGKRLNGPHVRTGRSHYRSCFALADDSIKTTRILNGFQHALVELVPVVT